MLSIENLSVRFGGVTAVQDLSFEVEEGEIFGVIGPNGAGKTTLFNAMTRLDTPAAGRVMFNGDVDLLRLQRHEVAARGVARTFQNLALFPSLTVLENVLMGAQHRRRAGAWGTAALTRTSRREERALRFEALEFLERLELVDLVDRQAEGLPFGTMKRIELARAMMAQPRLLMLDEPANGLISDEVQNLSETLTTLRAEFALTVLLVEHHMGMVMSICDRIVVLDFGRRIACGPPQEVRNDPAVVAAYLGGPS